MTVTLSVTEGTLLDLTGITAEPELDEAAGSVRVAALLPVLDTRQLMAMRAFMTDRIADRLASGALVAVLQDWSPPFSGYHLYYPSRRQPPTPPHP